MVRKQKRVAVYARVSTDGQTVANQRRELEAAVERHGWEIVEAFEDRGVSGARGRKDRPAMKRMMEGVTRREFDLVAAWSVDRLGRSLQDLIGFLEELRAKRVDLYLHQQGLDTTTPAGEALFGMLGVFAQFERALIKERVNAGLARAKAQGKVLGRPQEHDDKKRTAVLKARTSGDSYGKIAKALKLPRSTVAHIVKTAEVL
jgi:DNA invertase Pin-like site-specific DNA recombinase